jgi:predicted DNA-binding mobile mystery protein A
MTASQLAKRLEVSPAAVNKIEHSEANGTITLNSLRRAAEALDCGLVYALMPRTSLEEILAQQARRIAEKEFEKISKTMALEDQSVEPNTHHRMIDELAQELIDAVKKEIWND